MSGNQTSTESKSNVVPLRQDVQREAGTWELLNVSSDHAPWMTAAAIDNIGTFFRVGESRHIPLPPPYGFRALLDILQRAASLKRGVDVMSTNIGGFGYEVVPRFPELKMTPEQEAQRSIVEAFLGASGYECGGYTNLRKKKDGDFFALGNGYYRVSRTLGGDLSHLDDVKAKNVVMLQPDGEVMVEVPIFLPDGRVLAIPRPTRFYRFREWRPEGAAGGVLRYYKQLGDPRPLHAATGESRPAGGKSFGAYEAQEILHFKDDWPGEDHYGVPTWVGVRDEAAAEANLGGLLRHWTKKGLLDIVLVLLTNGKWGEGVQARLEGMFRDEARGWQNACNVILGDAIAAVAGEEATGDDNIKPGANAIQVVNLTSKLDPKALQEVLGNLASYNRAYAWGIPPSFYGLVQDDSQATADANREIAEERAFMPRRASEDRYLAQLLWPRMGVTHWVVRTKGAPTKAAAQAATAAAPFVQALSLNEMRAWLSQISGFVIPPVDEEWAKAPIAAAAAVRAGQQTLAQAQQDEEAVAKSAQIAVEFAQRVAAYRSGREPEIMDRMREVMKAAGLTPTF